MPPRERPADRGDRIARADLIRLGTELRLARVGAGLSLADVGRAVGLSGSQVSRVERAVGEGTPVRQLARIGSAVGLDVRTHAYPGPDPIRDAGQVRLLERFRIRIHSSLVFRTEVLIARLGDQRAWDGWIDGFCDPPGSSGLPVEAETRMGDLQAMNRRLALKMRDGGVDTLLLVIADTRANRAAIIAGASMMAQLFVVTPRAAWADLAAGRRPQGSALLMV